jgi:hypothetical protein
MKVQLRRRKKRFMDAHILSRKLRRNHFYSVESAGRQAGLGRTQSYLAARRGIIPTKRYGRRLLVRRRIWDREVRRLLRASDGPRRRTASSRVRRPLGPPNGLGRKSGCRLVNVLRSGRQSCPRSMLQSRRDRMMSSLENGERSSTARPAKRAGGSFNRQSSHPVLKMRRAAGRRRRPARKRENKQR